MKRFCGSVGQLNQGRLIGWMIDRESIEPANLSVYINGSECVKLTADMYRDDMRRKGLHVNGKCGFSLELNELGRVVPGDRVSIRAADGNFELTNSPFIVPG